MGIWGPEVECHYYPDRKVVAVWMDDSGERRELRLWVVTDASNLQKYIDKALAWAESYAEEHGLELAESAKVNDERR